MLLIMNKGKKIAVAFSPSRPQRIYRKRLYIAVYCLYYTVFLLINKEEINNHD